MLLQGLSTAFRKPSETTCSANTTVARRHTLCHRPIIIHSLSSKHRSKLFCQLSCMRSPAITEEEDRSWLRRPQDFQPLHTIIVFTSNAELTPLFFFPPDQLFKHPKQSSIAESPRPIPGRKYEVKQKSWPRGCRAVNNQFSKSGD